MSKKTSTIRAVGIGSFATFVLMIGAFMFFNDNSIERDSNFLTNLESQVIGEQDFETCEQRVEDWNEVISNYQRLIGQSEERVAHYQNLLDESRGSKKEKWQGKIEEINRDVVIFRNAIFRYQGFIDRCENILEGQ